ncbi:MAG: hypothetical protein RR334_00115 [Clostridia bacterium]
MKKIISLILVAISSLVVFAGCNKNENLAVGVSSVLFVSREIEAEFYEEKDLKFKVYPNNATYSNVTYSISSEPTSDNTLLQPKNISKEKLKEGKLVINKPNINIPVKGSINIMVNVDGKTSECKITLKPVLTKIEFSKTSIDINPKSYSYLSLKSGEEAVDLNKYNVEFSTSRGDIEIIDKRLGLIYCKELANQGPVEIEATLTYGIDKYTAKTTVNISTSIATDMFVNLGGKLLVNGGSTIYKFANGEVRLDLAVALRNSADQEVIGQEYNVIILNTNSVTYFKDENKKQIVINKTDEDVTFTLQIQTVTASGINTIVQTFNIKVIK